MSRRQSICFACVALVLTLWFVDPAAAQFEGRASPKTPRAHEEIVTEIDAGNLQKAHALWRDKLRKASSEAGDVKSVLDALAKNNNVRDGSAVGFRDDFLRELMQWLLDEQPASPPAAKLRRELETAEWNLRSKGWELPRAPAQVVAGNRRRLLFPITATGAGKRGHVPRYRLFRLPMDLALEHLLPLHPALNPYPAELKSIPVDTWQPVPIAVEIHQAAPGPLWQIVGGGADRLVADFAPGWYVLEREVNGLVVRSVLRSQTFELMCRWDRGQLVVYAVDVVDGRPIQDVEISLVSNANRDDQAPVAKLPSGRTNAEGWWQTTTSEKIDGIDVIGVRGVEQVFESLSGSYEYDATATNLTTEEDRVFITTDRPIYRPGQTVHFKAVGRRLRQGDLTQLDASPVRVEIRDRQGRIVHGHEYRWNEFGTMSGEFPLGDEPSLGEYAVVVQVPRQPDDAETPVDSEDQPWKRYWNAPFVVEAYRKPEVEVKVTPTLAGMSGQRRLRAQVSADYFLGGPVANAEVEWTVSYSPIAIAAMTDGSAFATWADLRNPLYAAHRARLREGSRRSDEFPPVAGQPMATGTSRADSQGQFLIDLPIPKQLEGMEFEVRATVRDLSRLSAEGQGKIAAAKESGWTIDLAADRVWCEPGKPVVAFLEVTDEAERSVADSEIELLTFWSDEINEVQVKGEGQREWITVASSKLRTGRDGRTQATFTPHASGLLRWRARTKDQEGRRVERRLQQWIVGEGAISGTFGFETSLDPDEEEDFGDGRAAEDAWFSRPTNLPMVVQPERVVYRPGETARLLVLSRIAPLSLFVSVDGAGFMRPRRIELKSRAQIIEIPVGEQDPHHLNVRVFAAAGAGRSAQAATFLLVERPERRLDVRLTADKLSYRPREKARFVLETRSAEGRGVPSEVELAIVDDALYSLGNFRLPSIDTAFCPVRVDESVMFGGAIDWGVNSTAYGEALFFGQNFTARQGDAFTFHPRGVLGGGGFGMGGGGGMAGMMGGGSGGGGGFFGMGGLGDGGAAADEEPAPTELRERLVDLWYWAAHVSTDEQGRAAVSLDVPDTLGRWRIVARAVSKTDQAGSVASQTLTTKPLLVRLAAPRFYTQGDEGTVGMIVRNDLTVAADCTVRLSVLGGEGGGEKRVTVPAGQQSRVDWTVTTPRPGTLTLKAEALSTQASDALELAVPVKPFGVAQRSTQSGTTRDRWTTQLTLPPDAIADSASLVVVADEPNVSAVRAALPSLMQYPYGCVEQTMSRFLPAVVARRALRTSGLSDAAFELELPRLVESGLQRLYGFQHGDGGWGWWKDDVTDGFMTSYVVFGLLTAKDAGFSIDPEVLDRALRFMRPYDGDPLDEVVARMAKITLEPKTARAEWDLKRIDEEERERHVKRHGFAATREERLAQLVFAGHAELASHLPVEPPQSGDPLAVRQVAWNIRARLSRNRQDPVVPKLVEWLLRQRQAGAWHSTLDTAYAVLALSELPRTMEARPKVTVVVNGQQVLAASEFPAAGLVVPASQLRKGENSVQVRSDGGGLLTTSATLRWHGPPREHLAEEARLAVGWKWERAQRTPKPAPRAEEDAGKEDAEEEEVEWIPLASGAQVRSGEILRVTVTAKALESADRMFIESPLAAGTEAVRPNHASGEKTVGLAFYDATHHEFRDDRVLTAYQEIGAPVEFAYLVRATLPGNYRVLPPTVAPMYEPDAVVAGASFGLRILARAN